MLREITENEICNIKDIKEKWISMPMDERLKSLIIGKIAFTKLEKEIINSQNGYYAVYSRVENKGIKETLSDDINVLIVDNMNKKIFEAVLKE